MATLPARGPSAAGGSSARSGAKTGTDGADRAKIMDATGKHESAIMTPRLLTRRPVMAWRWSIQCRGVVVTYREGWGL